MEVESNFLNDSVGTNGWKETGNRCRPKKKRKKKNNSNFITGKDRFIVQAHNDRSTSGALMQPFRPTGGS